MQALVEAKIKQLPPNLQGEVIDFIYFLLTKKVAKKRKKPKLNWVGGLKEHRDCYTALELQKMALEWR